MAGRIQGQGIHFKRGNEFEKDTIQSDPYFDFCGNLDKFLLFFHFVKYLHHRNSFRNKLQDETRITDPAHPP